MKLRVLMWFPKHQSDPNPIREPWELENFLRKPAPKINGSVTAIFGNFISEGIFIGIFWFILLFKPFSLHCPLLKNLILAMLL